MIEKTLRLPTRVTEFNLAPYLQLLAEGNGHEKVFIDFARVRFFIPVAITATVAIVRKWVDEGVQVTLINHKDNPAFSYLQRIDFFKKLGLSYKEDFQRRKAKNNFVTLQEVTKQSNRD
ncbi:MAG: hypothetical protein JJT75_03035 [Opitutales bacterium]|nr:hypothetical protein [Opitutales bacterium]MCH8541299.1 hypothetical protein [Opitutales bacterium]